MTRIAAILGGGVIGGGWAARFLLMGWDVTVYDPAPDAVRKLDAVLANARHALPMLYDTALPAEGTLTFADTLAEAVTGADWVQESIPERLELKHKLIAQVEPHLGPEAILASSTSGFKPSELVQGATKPDQIIVAHPFNPVYLLPVVELVGPAATCARASDILDGLGMAPITLRKEIDAHIADRLLEAVWRESLWLVKDGIATTEEIDEIIRLGFGLRWAQMGLFETYRIAGGEAGMKHFLAQFGPALKWPWTKLMDVPDLDEALIDTIASQSDAQSGAHSIRELERLRDENLVAMMRALKGRDQAAGALLNRIDAAQKPAPAEAAPIRTLARVVPIDWTDYNAHMNESRYGQVFSDAADEVMRMIGADADYVADGMSYFTVDIHIEFKAEAHAGQRFEVLSRVTEGAGKKLRLAHEMAGPDGTVFAAAEQLLIHVDLSTRRASEPRADVAEKLEQLAALHS